MLKLTRKQAICASLGFKVGLNETGDKFSSIQQSVIDDFITSLCFFVSRFELENARYELDNLVKGVMPIKKRFYSIDSE